MLEMKKYVIQLDTELKVSKHYTNKLYKHTVQGRSEGISSVAFEVLIMNYQIHFINLVISNCLTLNINLFIFNFFDVKFWFSENHIFRKQKETAAYGRAFFLSNFKLTRENDDLLIFKT